MRNQIIVGTKYCHRHYNTSASRYLMLLVALSHNLNPQFNTSYTFVTANRSHMGETFRIRQWHVWIGTM